MERCTACNHEMKIDVEDGQAVCVHATCDFVGLTVDMINISLSAEIEGIKPRLDL